MSSDIHETRTPLPQNVGFGYIVDLRVVTDHVARTRHAVNATNNPHTVHDA